MAPIASCGTSTKLVVQDRGGYLRPGQSLRVHYPGQDTRVAERSTRRYTGMLHHNWRRERDSNPRSPCELASFPGRYLKPLSHLSRCLFKPALKVTGHLNFPLGLGLSRGIRGADVSSAPGQPSPCEGADFRYMVAPNPRHQPPRYRGSTRTGYTANCWLRFQRCLFNRVNPGNAQALTAALVRGLRYEFHITRRQLPPSLQGRGFRPKLRVFRIVERRLQRLRVVKHPKLYVFKKFWWARLDSNQRSRGRRGYSPVQLKPRLPLAQGCCYYCGCLAGPHSARTTTSKPTSAAAAKTASRMNASNFSGSALRTAARVGYLGVFILVSFKKDDAGEMPARLPGKAALGDVRVLFGGRHPSGVLGVR